ncbi:MAG: GNAT family N-acetyltransferase [Candidatus Eremiobacteraeota bacterium]|nr:GNAT family N-acetyltransferase [Candidatus Eremiobacteraeota bacterium]
MLVTNVRRATPDDEECARAILDEYNEAAGVVLRDNRAALRSYLCGPGALWLAHEADAIVGCIALRPLPETGAATYEVKRLYVQPAYRGVGVADALLDALESHARTAGYRALYLDTHDGLAAAIRFYTRRGYVRIPRYNDNTQATIFMRRML